jgi:hypothetical protein
MFNADLAASREKTRYKAAWVQSDFLDTYVHTLQNQGQPFNHFLSVGASFLRSMHILDFLCSASHHSHLMVTYEKSSAAQFVVSFLHLRSP